MYSGSETVNAIRKLNSRGYAVTVEEKNDSQAVSLVFQGKVIEVFRDDVFGQSSDAVVIYGTAMKNMIDWLYENGKGG